MKIEKAMKETASEWEQQEEWVWGFCFAFENHTFDSSGSVFIIIIFYYIIFMISFTIVICQGAGSANNSWIDI